MYFPRLANISLRGNNGFKECRKSEGIGAKRGGEGGEKGEKGEILGVRRVGEEHCVEGEEVFEGDGIEDAARGVEVAGAGVEGDEFGGEEVVGDDGEDDEAAVETAGVEKETAAGEVLDQVADGEEVCGGDRVGDDILGRGGGGGGGRRWAHPFKTCFGFLQGEEELLDNSYPYVLHYIVVTYNYGH